MSKTKPPLEPALKKQPTGPAPTKGKGKQADDDDDRRKRPLVQVIGGAIVAIAIAVSMLVSVITPFFY